MERTAATFSSIHELYALGKESLLVWFFIHSNDDELASPLLTALDDYEFGNIPTHLVTLRLDQNEWIGRQMRAPSNCPELHCICCGGGLCRVSSLGEFEESVRMAVNTAKQLQPAWIGQRG
jgi:hypothetical protein